MKLRLILAACSGVLTVPLTTAAAMAATPCAGLADLHAPDVTITLATMVDAPSAISPALAEAASPMPFCRVGGFITPTSDSHIGFEAWLPATASWNRKFEAVGNGGLSGALNYRAMLPGFVRGYATMTTDLGHINTPAGSVEDASWAMGHPQKVIDYAYRAEHLATLAAKTIIDAFYGAAPAHSYYSGCSAGGIQGINEALRYSKDFDGYIIGDATPDHAGQEIGALWNTLAASLANSAEALKPGQISLVHKEILRQCAGKDGGLSTDPFLTDPRLCKFEPKTLQCKASQDAATCLTPAQVGEFENIYRGPVNPRTHEAILSGMTPGSELGWDRYFAGKTNPAGMDRPWAGFLVDMVLSDPSYLSEQKYLSFDFDNDYTAVRQAMVGGESVASSWNVPSRDLESFRLGGGKIIQYHGWDDPNIPALEAIKFYTEIVAEQARTHRITPLQALDATRQFYRLFMVQGMGHCNGGDGPSSFGQNGQRPLKDDAEHDTLRALELWVEKGVAPEKFIGARVDTKTNVVDMTRPICAYPKIPVWKGSGDVQDAGNFTCTAPSSQAPR